MTPEQKDFYANWIKSATRSEASREYVKLSSMEKTDASRFMMKHCREKLGLTV